MTAELLADAVASTVNLAEVQTKLVSRGWPSEVAWQDAISLIKEAVVFKPEHARLAGDLVARTQPLGLSLGDRACLALAMALNAPVYTTDKSWKNLKLNVPIHSPAKFPAPAAFLLTNDRTHYPLDIAVKSRQRDMPAPHA